MHIVSKFEGFLTVPPIRVQHVVKCPVFFAVQAMKKCIETCNSAKSTHKTQINSLAQKHKSKLQLHQPACLRLGFAKVLQALPPSVVPKCRKVSFSASHIHTTTAMQSSTTKRKKHGRCRQVCIGRYKNVVVGKCSQMHLCGT